MTDPSWLEVGQPVAVRRYGPGTSRVLKILNVARFTKTRIVLDDGSWFNRETLQSPRRGGTWSGDVLADPHDPRVVADIARQQVHARADNLATAVRRGEYVEALKHAQVLVKRLPILIDNKGDA